MGKIFVKKFLLSKSGVVNSGQDAIACNFTNGRFAVADGITNSFHPEFVAQALCKVFVDGNVAIQEWEQQLNSHILDEISELWAEKVESLSLQLAGRQRRHIEMNRETLPMGSSTFAGLECNLEKNLLIYRILGDSSLFIIPRTGDFSIVCSSRREERFGRKYVIYDNTPACISNFDYNCQGKPQLYFENKWEEGELPIVPGFVVLLTDGAAQWLQDALITDNKAIERLWYLNSEKAFVDFVSEQRVYEKMDDDLAIIILKIDSVTNDGFEEVIYYSNVQEGVFYEPVPMEKSIISETNVEKRNDFKEDVTISFDERPSPIVGMLPVEDNPIPTEDALIDGLKNSGTKGDISEAVNSKHEERVDDATSIEISTTADILVEEETDLDKDVTIPLEEMPTSIVEILPVKGNSIPTEDAFIQKQKNSDKEGSIMEEDSNQRECVDDTISLLSENALNKNIGSEESHQELLFSKFRKLITKLIFRK